VNDRDRNRLAGLLTAVGALFVLAGLFLIAYGWVGLPLLR
jgi:hypothetical protein